MKRLLLSILLLLLPLCASAEGLDLMVDGPARSYTENRITARVEAAGFLTLSVQDGTGALVTWMEEVEAGDNPILWDGTAAHGQPIPVGEYTLHGELSTYAGESCTASTPVTFARSENALLFALPSSDTLYLNEGGWFCEVAMARAGGGTICMDIYRAKNVVAPIGTVERGSSVAGPIRFEWNGRLNGDPLAPGEYLLRFSLADAPAYTHDVPLTLTAGAPETLPLAVTGPLLPINSSDEAVWAHMQQPVTVAKVRADGALPLQAEPGKGSKLGSISGQSQAVQVLELRDEYARIGAYAQENGAYIEGWVKQSSLTVVAPSGEYGLLIDKAAQKATLYRSGKRVASMPISTGLPLEKHLSRETPAGTYLTQERVSGECAIRYDGSTALRQADPAEIPFLGAKSTVGDILFPAHPGKKDLNAYYLYTYLPYRTPVVILDDPDARLLQSAAAGVPIDVPKITPIAPPALAEGEFELTLTVGGDAVIGTREAWWDRPDAFPAYLAQHGMAYPFAKLADIFAADDMTFVNLEGVLKADKAGETKTKEYRFRGLPEWTEVITAASIEQVSIANNHYIDYGHVGRDATRAALEAADIPYSGFETIHIWEQNGVKVGFGGCRETVYLDDPTIVYRDINAMKQAGCDVILYTCHWGTEYSPTHNDTQARIAAAATAAGADIILGGHPHVVQGIDTVQDTLVLYSLGNLMFGGTIDMTTFDAMLAQIRLRFNEEGYLGCTLELIPILTSGQAAEGINNYQPVVATGEDKARILQKVQDDTAFPLISQMWFPAQ